MSTSLSKYRDAELIAEYWRENGGRCEVSPYLPGRDREKVKRLRPYPQYRKLELHHIWHRSRHRIDTWSNVIIVDSIIHRNWGHDQNPIELTIASMYAKWQKKRRWSDLYDQEWNPNAKDFDLDELREAAGQNVIGWLDWKRNNFHTDSDYWRMCTEMIEFA